LLVDDFCSDRKVDNDDDNDTDNSDNDYDEVDDDDATELKLSYTLMRRKTHHMIHDNYALDICEHGFQVP